MKIHTIPVLNDNYIFILIDEIRQEACVVDPAIADPVISFLKTNNLNLTKIFNTHHHYDHIGGNKDLCKIFPHVEVYGGMNDSGRIPLQKHFLSHGDSVSFANEKAFIFYLPGHTLGHISYYFPLQNGEHHIFIGDTIFAGGCGKLFEGTMMQMFSSLKFLRDNLPNETIIWSAHEYTVENYLILQKLEPNNIAIKERLQKSIDLRKKNIFTIPFTLQEEKISSSFLRWDDPLLKEVTQTSSDFETFTFVRKFRDSPPKINFP